MSFQYLTFMKLKSTLFGFLCFIVLSSCSKDDEGAFKCKDCVDEPEAAAAFDASSKGIYKGVVIGSSGIIKFDIANDGSDITATLIIDDHTVNLTSDVTWVEDEYITAVFTGTLNEQAVSITFYVDGDGGEPEIGSVTIPGHDDVAIVIVKERSDELIKCFEGSYSGDASGTFNMVLSEEVGQWHVIARDNDSEFVSSSYGIIQGSAMTGGDSQGDVTIIGKLSGDEVSGTWESTDENGSWKGKRSL
jgi:hypothetical protein